MMNSQAIPFPALKNQAIINATDEATQKKLQNFITPYSLIEVFKIHDICIFTSKVFGILQEDFNKFNEKLQALFGFKITFNESLVNNDHSFKVKKFNNGKELLEHFQKIKNSRHDWRFVKRLQKHERRRNRVKQCYPEFSSINHDILDHNILCLDMEFFPYGEIKITEIGFVFFENGKSEYKHYLIKENKDLKKDCKTRPNNQGKFSFGKTKVITLEEAKNILMKYIKKTNYFIGHSAHSENFYLQQMGINLIENIDYVVDTQNIHMRMTNDDAPIALENLLDFMDIEYSHLHNAGNDAAYTWEIFKKQLEIID